MALADDPGGPRPVEVEPVALVQLDDGASRVGWLRIVVSFLVSSASVRHRSRSISRNASALARTLADLRER